MAKIYSPPRAITVPELDFSNVGKYNEECKEYINSLKKHLQKDNHNKYIGEVIRFSVADGYAEYMVANMRPLELIHIPLGDGWHFEYIHLLTAKEVKEWIEADKKLAKLFGGTK